MNQIVGPVAGTDNIRTTYPYRTEKRTSPTVAIYDTSGNGGTGASGRCNRSAANKAATVAVAGTSNVVIDCSDTTSAQGVSYHLTADAEL